LEIGNWKSGSQTPAVHDAQDVGVNVGLQQHSMARKMVGQRRRNDINFKPNQRRGQTTKVEIQSPAQTSAMRASATLPLSPARLARIKWL